MPVYTYRCENCGHQFDKRQSFNDEALIVCPSCGKHQLHKVYFPAGVSFKGQGFYVTDKRNSSSSTASSPIKGKENGTKEPTVKKTSGEKSKEPKTTTNEKAAPASKQTK